MGFVDLHSHILPGIDDGAKDIQQSLAMVEQAIAGGTRCMVATPHMLPEVYDNTPKTIAHSYYQLCRALQHENLDIEIYFAAELRLSPQLIYWQQQSALPCLGSYQGRRVILLELPNSHIPPGLNALLRWLGENGLRPMIAHPERNRGLWEHDYHLQSWRRLGCLFQVTAGSFLGEFRKPAMQLAEKMLQSDLVDVVASDCHGTEKRRPNLRPAYLHIEQQMGEDVARRLFIDTPGVIAASCPGRLAEVSHFSA